MELTLKRPQDDFYMSMNKKWLDDPKNQIPDDYSRWGGFMKLRDEGLINQIEMVKELETKLDKTEEEKKIPPAVGVGVTELLAKTTTLSDCTLNISILADLIKNILLITSTEAVTVPVAI